VFLGQVILEAVEQLHRWASVSRSGYLGGCGTAAQVSECFQVILSWRLWNSCTLSECF